MTWMKDAVALSKNAKKDLNLAQAGYAPICELSEEEFTAVLAKLKGDVEENWKPVKKRSERPASFSPSNIKEWSRNFLMKKQWNRRVDQTLSILRSAKKESLKNAHRLAYFIDGEPVGALLLQPRNPPYVADLVTHPGSEQAGGALMEHAVNLSKRSGFGGRLELIAENDNAVKAYKAMGFVLQTGSRHGSQRHMTLDPVKSQLWATDKEGNFKLAKYSEKQYLG
jgi:GNAT superfamily N-acetyltransferase